MENKISLRGEKLGKKYGIILIAFFVGIFVTLFSGWQVGVKFTALFVFIDLLLAMGCLFWLFLFAVTGARWTDSYMLWLGRMSKATLIFGGGGALFLLIFHFDLLYPWALEQTRGGSWYLNQPGIIIRLSLCLLVLGLLAWGPGMLLKKREGVSDGKGRSCSEEGRKYFRALSSMGLPVLFVVMAIWCVDGVMARDSHWHSSLWPVQVIVLSALLALCIFPVQEGGGKQNQNYGRCLLAFVLLHGYLLYSESMLVWFGRIPSETVYFSSRSGVSGVLWVSLLLSCLFPLVCLLFRNAKKKRCILHMVKIFVFVGVLLELIWRFFPWFDWGGELNKQFLREWPQSLGIGVLFVILFLPFALFHNRGQKKNSRVEGQNEPENN